MSLRLRLAAFIAGLDYDLLNSLTVRVNDDDPGWFQFGGGPNDRDWADLQSEYSDALTAWRKNPIARRIISITSDYTLGDGIIITSPHKPLQVFADSFWSHPRNKMSLRLETMCDELSRAGDLFPVLFLNPADGMSYLRFVIKPEIVKITTAENDWETELVYHQRRHDRPVGEDQEWFSPYHPHAADANAVMLHHRVNGVMGAMLGESDLGSMLPWLLKYSRMLEDRVRLNEAVRAFLWFVTVPSSKVKEKRTQYSRPPRAGSVVVKDDAEKWEMLTPNLQARDAGNDLKAIRNMINAGSFPPHWLGESGSSNLAEARAMQRPAERHLQRRQDYFIHILHDIIYHAYNRQPDPDPLPTADYSKLFTTDQPDVSREDNQELATAAREVAATYRELVLNEERPSRTLLSLFLKNTFKFMNEPQPEQTINKILDEIFTGLGREGNIAPVTAGRNGVNHHA